MSNFWQKNEANCNRGKSRKSITFTDWMLMSLRVIMWNWEVWHCRFGHLQVWNLWNLAKDELVSCCDYDISKGIGFCESCTEVNHHRSQFSADSGKRSKEFLGLVHSNICGKINAKSLSGAKYFLTFIDDCTRYVVLKRKDQAFEMFLE